jgi:hypothetical protein
MQTVIAPREREVRAEFEALPPWLREIALRYIGRPARRSPVSATTPATVWAAFSSAVLGSRIPTLRPS